MAKINLVIWPNKIRVVMLPVKILTIEPILFLM